MKQITIIGFGNQGKAWANNLRDSGWQVTVAGRSGGSGLKAANASGFATIPLAEAARKPGTLALLVPDHAIASLLCDLGLSVGSMRAEFSPPAQKLVFAHGFAVVHGGISFRTQDDLILVAPKGIGAKLRSLYQAGSGVLGVLGVEQDSSKEAWLEAKGIAEGLGCARIGLVNSSFTEETNADLLSEQAILCGLLPRLIRATVDFLVAQGVNPKVATYECLNESKLMIDMMLEKGIQGMFRAVSPNARIGGLLYADRLLDDKNLNAALLDLWQGIQTGSFAKLVESEIAAGEPRTQKALQVYEKSLVDEYR